MVFRSEKRAVRAGGMLVFDLLVRCFYVMFTCRSFFSRGRVGADAALAAVKASMDIIDDDGLTVGVVNHCHVHVRYRAVIEELSVFPVPSSKAYTAIAEAVVNPAVETDMRTPIARVPDIDAACPPPITRGPEKAGLRGQNPRAGNPIVAIVAVSPVAGSPDVASARAERLFVNGQRRRADMNRDTNGHLRRSRRGQ